jgi:hypothetical protein
MTNTFIIILLLLNLCFLIILTIGYYIVNWTSIATLIQGISVGHNPEQNTTVLSGLPQNMPHSDEYLSSPARPSSIDLADIPMQIIHRHATLDLESAVNGQKGGSDNQSERTICPKHGTEVLNPDYEEYFDLFTRPTRREGTQMDISKRF